MADYWKSQGRKFCDFCKCWIADNKPSVDFHEGGKKHKENVSKRLKEIHKSSAKRAKQEKKFEDDLRKMENAGMAAYLKDVENSTKDLTAERIIKEKLERQGNNDAHQSSNGPPAAGTPETNFLHGRRNHRMRPEEMDPCDPMSYSKNMATQPRQPRPIKVQQSSDNKAQGKSKPTKGKGKGRKNQEEEHPKKCIQKFWYEAFTPEGYAYYWHIETNESVWEPPEEGYMTLAEQEEEVKEQAIQEEFFKQLEEEEEKSKMETLEEQRANEERERLKAFRKRESEATAESKVKTENKVKTEPQEDTDAPVKEEEDRPYWRDYSIPIEPQLPARKGWQVVRTIEKKKVDLQLPVNKVPVLQPVLTFDNPEPPVKPQRVFKEKIIEKIRTEDSDDEGPSKITFKKRKIGNKSVRKRMEDD